MEEPTERKTKFRIVFDWHYDVRDIWHKDIDVLLPLGTIITPYCDDELWGSLRVSAHNMIIQENLLVIETTDNTGDFEGIRKAPDWFKEAMQAAGWIHNAENPYTYDHVV